MIPCDPTLPDLQIQVVQIYRATLQIPDLQSRTDLLRAVDLKCLCARGHCRSLGETKGKIHRVEAADASRPAS